MMLAGESDFPSRRSKPLRCSARNRDCKRIELWRISFYMGAEGESILYANLSGKRTK